MTACVAMVDPLVKGFKWLRKKAVPRRRRDLFRRLDILVIAEVAILLLTDEAGMAMRNSSTRAMVSVIVRDRRGHCRVNRSSRSEEHTSEFQSLMRISYAVFCLKKKNNKNPS